VQQASPHEGDRLPPSYRPATPGYHRAAAGHRAVAARHLLVEKGLVQLIGT